MPQLVVAYLDGTEEHYPLAAQDVFIGRDTQLLVSIPDSKISRRHARLFLRRGSWFIEDLGSVNGVIIDGVRISTSVAVGLGQNVHIGDAVLRLAPSREEASPKGSPAAASAGAHPEGAVSPTTWILEVTAGELKGHKVTLGGPGPKTLGRDTQADLTLPDSSISRRHARLTAGFSEVTLEDLSSSNGSFINGQQVTQGVARSADTLRFGNVSVLLRQSAKEASRWQQPNAASGRNKAAGGGAEPGRGRMRQGARRRIVWGLGAVVALVALVVTAQALWPKLKAFERTPHAAARKARDPLPAEAQAQAQSQREGLDGNATGAEVEARASAPAPAPIETRGPGRLSRAWAQLRGEGPSSEEKARGRALAALYAKALAQSRTADRESALATVRELLAQDALHAQGRALQGQLLAHASEAEALRRAQIAMQGGQALQALGVVSQALDMPYAPNRTTGASTDDQPGRTSEAAELAALGEQAALQLSQACGERAQAACMAQAWAPCIAQLSCLLGYQPEATQGLALLTLATDAVYGIKGRGGRDHADAPNEALDAGPLAAALQTVAMLTERYPQAALRQAVLVYSTGDIGAASQKLHPLTCPQCRVVGADVRRVALGLPRAKQLRESGQHEAATALYDAVLAADARLCPTPTASVLHQVAQEGKQAVLLLQGAAAFERGAYKEALAFFLAGRAVGPKNDGLDEAVARLNRRAQDILTSIQASLGKPDAKAPLASGVCAHLEEVVSMTPTDHPTHERASRALSRCAQGPKAAP